MKFDTSTIRMAAVAAIVASLAACAPPPAPPPPPPPPPPPVAVIPPRPIPPNGAFGSMVIPQIGADGVRQTVNANLSPAQTTWNLRSALNVAALNCLETKHMGILPNYKTFLTAHAGSLSATNRTLAGEFRKRFGPTYRDAQDSYMTQVYNYFALPPALDNFCDVSLEVSNDLRAVPKGQLDLFAATALPRIETVFENFYRAYEQYRTDLAAWDASYGRPTSAAVTTGYFAPLDPAAAAGVGGSGSAGGNAQTAPGPTYGPAQEPGS